MNRNMKSLRVYNVCYYLFLQNIMIIMPDCVFITTSDAGCDDFVCTKSWNGGVCSGKYKNYNNMTDANYLM